MDVLNDLELETKRNQLLEELNRVEMELKSRKKMRKESSANSNGLTNGEISRFSRQLILPEFGVQGQLKLKTAKALIVGCGGLGCPAAQYLASCGLGTLGLVDYDQVELNNLHRQILHSERKVGVNKAESVRSALLNLYSDLNVLVFKEILKSSNALEIIKPFDVILDATDNVASRYLLNDACVLAKKPLVSGSALRFEGQMTVYNYKDGPTYRCLFPEPPPPETVTNCSDGGVLGVIPGIIGTLQALETIKLITGVGEVHSGKMLMFDGLAGGFRTFKLRPRNPKEVSKVQTLIDYEQFCGALANDKDQAVGQEVLLRDEERISVQQLKELLDDSKSKEGILLLDVRDEHETQICRLENSFNFPLKKIRKANDKEIREKTRNNETNGGNIIVLCHRGNDSQIAVRKLKEILGTNTLIRDVKGGLQSWANKIDPQFPIY